MPDLMYCAVKALIERKGKILFVVYSDGHFDFPGGRLDVGEDPYDALKREVKEETGFDVRIGRPIGMYYAVVPNDGNQVTLTLFECFTDWVGEPVNSSPDEIARFAWLSFEEALKANVTHESLRGLLKKYFEERG